jgi:hypothetical protein
MTPSLDPVFCAYAAGFIDGEGCLAITSRRKPEGRATYYETLMVVSQIDPAPLRELQAAFGGSIHILHTEYRIRKAWRPAHRWHLSGTRLRACLQSLRPYLRVKAAQADLMLEFFEVLDRTRVNYGRAGMPDSAETLRRSYYDRLKQMHRPGVR